VPIKNSGLALEGWARIGRYDWSDAEPNSPSKVRSSGDYFEAGISVLYKFSKTTKLDIGWHYEKGINNYIQAGRLPKVPDPDAVSRGFLNVELAYSFR
jgi:hypothetical protein